jgi:hypothetical protein
MDTYGDSGSFYKDFDSLIDGLGQMLGLHAAKSALTPHAGLGMTDPNDRGGSPSDVGGPMGGGGLLDMVRGRPGEQPMDGGLPLDPSKSIDMATRPMGPAPTFPPTPPTAMPPDQGPPQLPPLPPPPVQTLGSDANRSGGVDPQSLAQLKNNFDAVPPPFVPGTPNMLGGEAPGGVPGAPGATPPPPAPPGVPLPPPRPPGAPGALPPNAAPVAQPLTPPAPLAPPTGALPGLPPGINPAALGINMERNPRGGVYTNDQRRLTASLGAGLSGLDKHPGSKFGAFAGGFGKSIGGGAAQDEKNREQDEKERHTEFQEGDTIYKRLVHDPLDLAQKNMNIAKGKAGTDYLNAKSSALASGKPFGANSKSWNDPFMRQILVDREIQKKQHELESTFRTKWSKYDQLSTAQKQARDVDEKELQVKKDAIQKEFYTKYKIDPATAAKNQKVGQDEENAFDPTGKGLSKEEFDQLVPPGAWFIPKPGAKPVRRAPRTMQETMGAAAEAREQDVKAKSGTGGYSDALEEQQLLNE